MKFTDNTANVSQSHDAPSRSVSKWFLLSEVRKELSGTRGQSRYHYYGLAVKETSPYYDPGITWKIAKDLTKRILMKIFQSSPLAKGDPSPHQVGHFLSWSVFFQTLKSHTLMWYNAYMTQIYAVLLVSFKEILPELNLDRAGPCLFITVPNYHIKLQISKHHIRDI